MSAKTIRVNRSLLSSILLDLLSLLIAAGAASAFQGPLSVSGTNPRYFTDNSGMAIYVTGSHTWCALADCGADDPPSPFDFASYLDFLNDHHHNFIRLWSWGSPVASEGEDYGYSAPQPWLRTGPGTAWDGKPKFDLNSVNDQYFNRLRQRVIDAGERGFYVDVTFFEGWYLASQQAGRNNDEWSSHPFNSANNINGIDADTNGDGHGYEFYTLSAPSSVIAIQEAYVSRVLDAVNDLDNVIYEIVTEATPDSVQWQYMMINFVKHEMEERGKAHPVGMSATYLEYDNTSLLESPADWISPGTGGGYETNPPVANGTKLILLDSDHLWGFDQNRDASSWVWRSFTRGDNVIFMDDPGMVTTNLERSRRAMGDTLRYAEKMDLNAMLPSTTLCSTTYCLQNPGKEYLVYQPSSGEFGLTVVAGTYSYEWFNPVTDSVVQTGSITLSRGSRSFTPPFTGPAVLYLSREPYVPDTTPPSPPGNLTTTSVTSSDVTLGWMASTDNMGISGYKIYRDGAQIGTASATSYSDDGLTPSTSYTYQVSAFDAAGNDSTLSAAITVTTLGLNLIPRTDWSLKYVDSQETSCENGAAVNAFDNNNSTFWHTSYCGVTPPLPHEIQINLGASYSIDGFRYLPRQDGEINGTIAGYEFYVSTDGANWGTPVATGTFANNTNEKEVRFTATMGRYVRLRALSEVNGNPWTSVAEINVLGTAVDDSPAPQGVIEIPSHDTAVSEDPYGNIYSN